MTYRFSNGHRRSQDGTVAVTRPWNTGRYGAPMGAMISSNVADQLAWARFHMGDGTAPDGTRILSEELRRQMQEPTGLVSWERARRRRRYQLAAPRRRRGPRRRPRRRHLGPALNLRDGARTGLRDHEPHELWTERLGVQRGDHSVGIRGVPRRPGAGPEPVRLEHEALAAYAGRYETIAALCDVTVADGGLVLDFMTRPEVLAQLGEEASDDPPEPLGILPGEGDRYVVTDGPAKGMRGYFSRGHDGSIDGMHVGGRYAKRVR